MNPTLFWGLDLEMEQPSNEIISVGIAYNCLQTIEQVEMDSRTIYSWDVVGVERKNFLITPSQPLSPFIQELTGLTDRMFDQNKSRDDCFREVLDFIASLLSIQGMVKEPIVWGQGDLHLLRQQCFQCSDLLEKSFQVLPRRFTDVKTLISHDELFRTGKRVGRMSLSSALSLYNMKFAGNAHNSADDAANTLELYMKFSKRMTQIYNTLNQGANLLSPKGNK